MGFFDKLKGEFNSFQTVGPVFDALNKFGPHIENTLGIKSYETQTLFVNDVQMTDDAVLVLTTHSTSEQMDRDQANLPVDKRGRATLGWVYAEGKVLPVVVMALGNAKSCLVIYLVIETYFEKKARAFNYWTRHVDADGGGVSSFMMTPPPEPNGVYRGWVFQPMLLPGASVIPPRRFLSENVIGHEVSNAGFYVPPLDPFLDPVGPSTDALGWFKMPN